MKYQILRTLPQIESDLISSKSYLENIAKALDREVEDLVVDLEKYIYNSTTFSPKEVAFFDYIIELCTLTFVLFKWGLLLFHIDSKMLGNYLTVFEIENEFYLARESGKKVILEDLGSGKKVFESIEAKSAVMQLLIYISSNNAKISIVEVFSDETIFDGSRVSFDEERYEAQKDEIELIRGNFSTYKTRLESLQNIFVENFGNLKAFDHL